MSKEVSAKEAEEVTMTPRQRETAAWNDLIEALFEAKEAETVKTRNAALKTAAEMVDIWFPLCKEREDKARAAAAKRRVRS